MRWRRRWKRGWRRNRGGGSVKGEGEVSMRRNLWRR